MRAWGRFVVRMERKNNLKTPQRSNWEAGLNVKDKRQDGHWEKTEPLLKTGQPAGTFSQFPKNH